MNEICGQHQGMRSALCTPSASAQQSQTYLWARIRQLTKNGMVPGSEGPASWGSRETKALPAAPRAPRESLP